MIIVIGNDNIMRYEDFSFTFVSFLIGHWCGLPVPCHLLFLLGLINNNNNKYN